MTRHKPAPNARFELSVVDRETREQPSYSRDGHTARTLVRASDLRVVYVTMKAGSHIAEHRAKGTASVQVVSGSVRLRFADRALDVTQGQLLAIEPSLPHEVEAIADSALLITFGWRGDA